MKRDFKILLHEVEAVLGRHVTMASDFERLASSFLKKHIVISPVVLRKVWSGMEFWEKLSPETLDKLSLFAGFQNWNDFRKALHGGGDACLNVEDMPQLKEYSGKKPAGKKTL